MNIAIIGAGLSGATMARILAERGHWIFVFEKEDVVGGACASANYPGVKHPYCIYGGYVFHTNSQKVWDFVNRFELWYPYELWKGVEFQTGGNIWNVPFPIPKSHIEKIQSYCIGPDIRQEIEDLPDTPDLSTLQSASRDIYGHTLSELLVESYSKTMWGKHYGNLTGKWAPKRLNLVDRPQGLFDDKYQGVPVNGYSHLTSRMLGHERIAIKKDNILPHQLKNDFDLIITSASIYDNLPYRSAVFVNRLLPRGVDWPNQIWGSVNTPLSPLSIRKINFSIQHGYEQEGHHLVQYMIPCEPHEGTNRMKLYPVNTPAAEKTYGHVLGQMLRHTTIMPIGRLGLFKYMNMDTAIETSMAMADYVGIWSDMHYLKRMEIIEHVRGS